MDRKVLGSQIWKKENEWKQKKRRQDDVFRSFKNEMK